MPTVLLVDDEPNIRWTLEELLKREGYDTFTSPDFESAMSILSANAVDAAVVDIVLPLRSGVDLLKAIQHREPYVPVIMVTGQPDLSHIPELVRAGAYDFLSKPVHKEALLGAISRAVERKRLIDAKQRLEIEVRTYAEQLEALVVERTSELAEANRFLDTVLNSSTEYAIVAEDMEGRVALFNRGAEMMSGYAAQDMLGRQAGGRFGFAVEANLDSVVLRSYQDLEDGAPFVEEIELFRRDGSSFVASLAVTQIRDPEGCRIGYLGIIKDLTEHRRNEEKFRQMQTRLVQSEKIAALGRMAAQVAHEVRNPLAGIRLYTLHLRAKMRDRLDAGEIALCDKLANGIEHLSATVDRVLNFARPMTLTMERHDLNRVVSEAVQLLEPQLTTNGVRAELLLVEGEASAALDEPSMKATLINLILNSIQAMPTGGRLCVRTTLWPGGVALEIEDTGCGIDPEQVEKVFEPFYTTKSQGLGLGMSYAARVIEQHGGSIHLESRSGEGTRVRIILPIESE